MAAAFDGITAGSHSLDTSGMEENGEKGRFEKENRRKERKERPVKGRDKATGKLEPRVAVYLSPWEH